MKLLIADDEILIREAIIARIKKGNYLFDEILQAENGLEAKQLIKEHKPELVITDVRMDGMTGLDLIKSCQALSTPSVFIVISGYAEFEYVQNALYHGACCYLLKPITQEKLFDALDKAAEKYDALIRLTIAEEKNTLLELGNLFRKCVGNSIEDTEYSQMLSLLGAGHNSYFILGSAHLSRYNQDRYFSIENVYSTLTGGLSSRISIAFQLLPGEHAQDRSIIFWDSHLPDIEKDLLDAIQSQIRKMNVLGATLTLGLSPISAVIGRDIFMSSEHALSKRFLTGNGKVYQAAPETSDSGHLPPDIKTLEHELLHQTPQDTALKLFELIENYYPLVHNAEYLLQYVYETLIRLNFYPDKTSWDSLIQDKYWSGCENKEELLAVIKKEIDKTCLMKATSEEISITEMVKEYLQSSYAESLTLDRIAQRYHLNPRYFSTLFKKKEGISPMDYLTQIRMEAAKNILLTTDTAAASIAQLVGYEDPRYFYKVFKKQTGMTPTEYRNMPVLPNNKSEG